MPDAFEEQAVLVAAEQAAAEGDTVAAELHLRRLLDLQTARLGPEHAEVASTLHNLAVVCERASRISEAEGLYRQAYAVAAAALPPTDQLVVRCQDDLNAFLDARMVPRQPPLAPAVAPPVSARPAASPASGVRKPTPSGAGRTAARPPSRVRPPVAPVPQADSPSALWMGVAIAGGVILAGAVGWLMFGRTAAAPAPVTAAVAVAAPAKRPAAAPKKATPAVSAVATTAPPAIAPGTTGTTAPAPAPSVEPLPPAEPDRAAAAESPAADDGRTGEITVTDARLCGELSTEAGWTCTAPQAPFGGGRLYFLTRLDVPETMQVEHRWLHGGEVVQSVRLRVQAVGRPGYRTYSRQTIDAARSGEWRIELRGPDGAVLAEQRIDVQ
jgi:hypothetical protein